MKKAYYLAPFHVHQRRWLYCDVERVSPDDHSRFDCLAVSAFLGYLLWPRPIPYVNPLHTEFSKWKMASGLVEWSVHSKVQHPNCEITITHYSDSYPTTYVADFEEILDTAR